MVMMEWMLWNECFVVVVGEFVGYCQEIEHFPQRGHWEDCGIVWVGVLWRDS